MVIKTLPCNSPDRPYETPPIALSCTNQRTVLSARLVIRVRESRRFPGRAHRPASHHDTHTSVDAASSDLYQPLCGEASSTHCGTTDLASTLMAAAGKRTIVIIDWQVM
ncbi:hypothetical protein E2C01_016657 [Portunus trituberculatus]|uniref:Uncharacterized protein n=1 Tax=Portunus trituberculatus TaxID=210409 RepID=A0A5B7DRA6_PORTR|nr:hypothetical protein [Portunus trituberculatus]